MIGPMLLVFAISTAPCAPIASLPAFRANQADYQAGLPIDLVVGRTPKGSFPTGAWTLKEADRGKVVATGVFAAAHGWNALHDSAVVVSLPSSLPGGTYGLESGKTRLGNFRVSATTDRQLFRTTMKAFYHNRSGSGTSFEFAGSWARPAGHPDTLVKRHSSTGQNGTLSSPKGWYDAGDYGKYIVNSGITCWTLLDLAESHPAVFDTLSWPIPAGSEPPLLREARWNLDWMLSMQDADGGVYHKLTTLKFDAMTEQPHQDLADRYVVMKTTAATLDFASVFFKASRVFAKRDSAYAARCASAAERAWAWSVAHPATVYHQPPDVKTGKYEDTVLTDERLLAAVERRIQGGDDNFWMPFRGLLDQSRNEASWQDVGALALYAILAHPRIFAKDTAIASARLLERARVLRDRSATTAYGVSIDSSEFVWGSNAVLANQGIHLLQAFRRSGDSGFLAAARRDLGYLLGANPFDSSFVTGVGLRPARHPHHRPSAADTVLEPVPGFLVGGGHLGGQDAGANPWQCKDYRVGGAPALSWTDQQCSYATNEVAINWNAALVGLVGGFIALRECPGGCYSVGR
ncbi:MAG: glycoside hydrolase family 9 protein [Fibrobacteres bacterium]|nr:glycoside hydrolase family 9 protein [Fibrobacterota bacterium]